MIYPTQTHASYRFMFVVGYRCPINKYIVKLNENSKHAQVVFGDIYFGFAKYLMPINFEQRCSLPPHDMSMICKRWDIYPTIPNCRSFWLF